MRYTFSQLKEWSGLSAIEIANQCGVSERTVYRWVETNNPHPLAFKKLEEIVTKVNHGSRHQTSKFKFIDLFAGIGGFRRAFDSIGGQCVFTSEWDKSSRITYQANYKSDHPIEGDIREFTKDEVSLSKIPKHDLLVAGFPCQPFSLAGVSKKNALGRNHGFKCDTQGTLFFDVAQILDFHRPAAFLLENVKNLISHDGGNTFKIIRRTLEEELGYKIKYKVIDGKSWVPQHRERIFIVGFKDDMGFSFDSLSLPQNEPVLSSILHGYQEDESDEIPYCINGEAAAKYTLSDNLWRYLQEYKRKHELKGNGFGYGLVTPIDIARTLSARYHKDGSEILISRGKRSRPRRLTPRECARLMGFDLPGENKFKIPVSDTQAYRQFGNSVIVPCASAIARLMKRFINESITDSSNKKIISLRE